MQSSIQKIEQIAPHPNADRLEIIKMEGLGWQVVAQKDIHKVGDKVIYVEIDSIVPEREQFEFLRGKRFRVRPIRLRQELSYGLILPLKDFGVDPDVEVGTDVDDITEIKHYEKELPKSLGGIAKGNFPTHIIPKTDEYNLLNSTRFFDDLKEVECYISLKADGSSFTAINDNGDISVCSRKLILERSESNAFWNIYDKYNVGQIPNNIAIQGELVGPKVNGNNLGLNEYQLFVFNVYDISEKGNYKMFGLDEMTEFCNRYELPIVKVLYRGVLGEKFATVQDLVDFSMTVKYDNGSDGEGIVIRPTIPVFNQKLNRPFSVKVINPNYKD